MRNGSLARALTCLGVIVFCGACMHGHGTDGSDSMDWSSRMHALEGADPRAWCDALGAEHPEIVYRASQLLFEHGAAALHDLILSLSDRRPTSRGYCGSSFRESSFTIHWDKPTEGEGGAAPTVADRSLYLIEAIARGDFEFRRHCYREIPPDLLLAIQARLLALEDEAAFQGDSLAEILQLLGECSIGERSDDSDDS